jgi:hypothetical protein
VPNRRQKNVDLVRPLVATGGDPHTLNIRLSANERPAGTAALSRCLYAAGSTAWPGLAFTLLP